MVGGLIGKKIGTSQVFNEKGEVIPVTVINAGPCTITTIRTKEKEGYEAVQLGYLEMNTDRAKKPYKGIFAKKGLPVFEHLAEFPLIEDGKELKVGDKVTIELFKVGEKVDISGYTKGKGFAGAVKRWGFHGAPGSHGTSKVHRKPMSAGATDAARVFKGKRSPGRMGNKKRTIKNLKVIDALKNENLLIVKGSIPGKKGGIVKIFKKWK